MAILQTEASIQAILDDEGYEDVDSFLEDYALESVVPGRCMNEECGGVITRCEPDLEDGWCEGCGQKTVKSALILIGII